MMTMRSAAVAFLVALLTSSAIAADNPNAEVATLVVDVDIVPKIDDGLADADIVDGHKELQLQLELQKNDDAADGSKGTHYGDPAEGCRKDEVRAGTCYSFMNIMEHASNKYLES